MCVQCRYLVFSNWLHQLQMCNSFVESGSILFGHSRVTSWMLVRFVSRNETILSQTITNGFECLNRHSIHCETELFSRTNNMYSNKFQLSKMLHCDHSTMVMVDRAIISNPRL